VGYIILTSKNATGRR